MIFIHRVGSKIYPQEKLRNLEKNWILPFDYCAGFGSVDCSDCHPVDDSRSFDYCADYAGFAKVFGEFSKIVNFLPRPDLISLHFQLAMWPAERETAKVGKSPKRGLKLGFWVKYSRRQTQVDLIRSRLTSLGRTGVALRMAGSWGKRSVGKSHTFKSQISVPRKIIYSNKSLKKNHEKKTYQKSRHADQLVYLGTGFRYQRIWPWSGQQS